MDTSVVAEERPPGSEPGAERRRRRGRIDAEGDDGGVRDLHLVLEADELAEERLLLGTPPAAIGRDDERVAAAQVPEPAAAPGVVGELDVRERWADLEVHAAMSREGAGRCGRWRGAPRRARRAHASGWA